MIWQLILIYILVTHLQIAPDSNLNLMFLEMFFCSYCDYTNQGEERLLEHQEVVHEGAVTRCPICDAVIKFRSNLDQHILAMHGTKTFPCEECAWVSRSKVLLNRHRRDCHKEKPYKCDICDFRASTQSNLKRHGHYRSNFKHQCDKCGKKFLYINLLKRHTIASSCSRFSCTDCPYKTDDREQFENHRKSKDCEDHKNNKKKYYYMKSLVEKVCDLCYKTFSCQSSLARHKKNKKCPEKPVDRKVCDLCHKIFSNQPSLSRHKTKFHGEFNEKKGNGNRKNLIKEKVIKITVDSVEILLKAEKDEEIHTSWGKINVSVTRWNLPVFHWQLWWWVS